MITPQAPNRSFHRLNRPVHRIGRVNNLDMVVLCPSQVEVVRKTCRLSCSRTLDDLGEASDEARGQHKESPAKIIGPPEDLRIHVRAERITSADRTRFGPRRHDHDRSCARMQSEPDTRRWRLWMFMAICEADSGDKDNKNGTAGNNTTFELSGVVHGRQSLSLRHPDWGAIARAGEVWQATLLERSASALSSLRHESLQLHQVLLHVRMTLYHSYVQLRWCCGHLPTVRLFVCPVCLSRGNHHANPA
jgi:hypothetical protein